MERNNGCIYSDVSDNNSDLEDGEISDFQSNSNDPGSIPTIEMTTTVVKKEPNVDPYCSITNETETGISANDSGYFDSSTVIHNSTVTNSVEEDLNDARPDDSSAFGFDNCDYQENDLLANNDARPDDSRAFGCDKFDDQGNDLLASNVNLDAAICNRETDKFSECQQVTPQTAKKPKFDAFIEKNNLSVYMRINENIKFPVIESRVADAHCRDGDLKLETAAHNIKEENFGKFKRRQWYFLRTQHGPVDFTFREEHSNYESICLFGQILENYVFREDGKKYFYYTAKPYGSVKKIYLFFVYYQFNDRSLQIQITELRKIKSKTLCIGGNISQDKLFVDFIYVIPDFIVKSIERTMYDEYTYRLRLRVAVEIYNWSNQIYINHGENMRRQDIIAKENLYGVHRFADLQHIIKNRDWLKWTELLGCKLGISCEKDHKEKIGVQNVSVELLNYSKFFDINYSLENPVTDWIDDVDFDNFNEDS